MGQCTLNRSAHIASRCSQGATPALAARLRRCRLRSTVERVGGRPVRAQAPVAPPNALHALRCPKYTKYAKYAKWRNRRVAAFILGARSPRTRPRARARARARYLKKNHAAHFPPTESLEQKIKKNLLMCAQWTNLGGVILIFFEKMGCFEKYFQELGRTGGGL